MEQITTENRMYKTANLIVQMKDGTQHTIDLLPFSGKHEDTARQAREFLRTSKQIDVTHIQQISEPVCCPSCGILTTELKIAETGVVFFLLLYISYETTHVIGCRSCVARQLVHDAMINLVTFNIVWPLYLVVVVVPQMLRLMRTGHEAKALDYLS